jgi:hypothetical protein
MTGREDDDEGLAQYGFDGQRPVTRGKSQKTGVNLSVAKRLKLFARPQELERKLDVRVQPPEGRQESREDIELGGRHVADDQLSSFSTPRTARDVSRPLRLSQGQPGFDEKAAPRIRELDSAVGPMKKADAEILLQAPDLLTERRLRDVKSLGGPPEVELFRDSDEVPEVT